MGGGSGRGVGVRVDVYKELKLGVVGDILGMGDVNQE